MAAFDIPDGSPLVDDDKRTTTAWLQVFARWQRAILANIEAGTTANRPTKGLWVGRRYYDQTLGKPVWVHQVSPVVWHDASGAVA